ncbi:ATP-binding cassette domain-containing protein [Bosea sp. TWI1241]|uniref:ATP-binding cassette domain-containing protein n=1 Tax=Bosea sp. TWI1241 TaxID=3148904 RepID=UPI0032095096
MTAPDESLAALLPLAGGRFHALPPADGAPMTLRGGEADLYLAPGEGGGAPRFVAALPEGTVLPGTATAVPLLLRPRVDVALEPGGEAGGAAFWLAALTEAADLPAGGHAAPETPAIYAAETDRLLAIVAERLASAERREASDAAGRSAAAEDDYTETLGGFGRLLAGRFSRPPTGVRSPLAVAAARLVELRRIKPQAVREQEGEAPEAYVERVATAHGLRLRRIRLDIGTRPDGDGPILAFDEAGRPLVLRPRLRGGYLVETPQSAAPPRRMTEADWRRLGRDGYILHATLPAGRLDYRTVTLFGLRDSLGDFGLLAACGIVGALLALLPPIASEQIATIAVHTADVPFLANLLVVLLVALVAETCFFVIGHLAELKAQGRAGLALHAAMVDRLLRLPPSVLRGANTLILATQMETVEKFRRALLGFGTTALLALFNGLAAAALVAFVSPLSGLIAIALVLVLLAVTALIGWAQFKAIYEGERMDVVVLAFVYDLIRLVPVVRAARLEKRAFTQWSENFLAFQSRLMRSARVANRLAVLEPFWEALVLALCFVAIAYAGASAHLDAGQAIVFVLALGRLLRAGKELSHAVMGAARLLPMAKLARPLIEYEVEPLAAGAPVTTLHGAVEMREVDFHYGSRRVLNQVSLSIAPGEFVGFVGPSGSGKSTTLALLTGLDRPDAGRVLLDGQDLAGLDRRQVARHVGMVLQNSRLFPGTIFENIRSISGIETDEAWHLAEQAGIADELRALPMGMHTIVGETGSGLAAGQVQRLLIARALAGKPGILVLDEAMSALDGASQRRILASLERLSMTRILVAHRPATLAGADRLFVFDQGAIVASGPPQALLRRAGEPDDAQDLAEPETP